MIIAIDFDDVVADFYAGYLLFYNRKHGTSFAKEHLVGENFADVLDIDPEKWLAEVHGFIANGFLELVGPMAHAKETLAILANNHELHLVTSRSQRFFEVTMRWKNIHGVHSYFSGFHFCGNSEGSANWREKNEVCKEIGAELLIDDHPRHAFMCVADNIHVMVFDQPWNRRVPQGNKITRISSWRDKAVRSLCEPSLR